MATQESVCSDAVSFDMTPGDIAVSISELDEAYELARSGSVDGAFVAEVWCTREQRAFSWTCVCVCVSVSVCLFRSLSLSMCLCLCLRSFVCVCTFVGVYLCICGVSLCVRAR